MALLWDFSKGAGESGSESEMVEGFGGLEFRVWDLRFAVWGLGVPVSGIGMKLSVFELW